MKISTNFSVNRNTLGWYHLYITHLQSIVPLSKVYFRLGKWLNQKVLVKQGGGPDSISRTHIKSQVQWYAHVIPALRNQRLEKPLDWLTNHNIHLVHAHPVRDPVSKRTANGPWGMAIEAVLWPLPTQGHVHRRVYGPYMNIHHIFKNSTSLLKWERKYKFYSYY